jgi:hypothetical protein
MLQDELCGIRHLIQEISATYCSSAEGGELYIIDHSLEIASMCREIRDAWNAAVFSDAPDHSLKRYFYHHLEGIREILDTFCNWDEFPEIKKGLIGLIEYQLKYFRAFFNEEAMAPIAFLELVDRRVGEALAGVKEKLKKAILTISLKNCLFAYLGEMDFCDRTVSYTYRSVFYFEQLIAELDVACLAGNPDNTLTALLTRLNFNSLAFFVYRKGQLNKAVSGIETAEKLALLERENEDLKLLPETGLIYDRRWPPLAVMLSGWLEPEIAAAGQQLKVEATFAFEKLPLNLSVAHLACMLKLFVEEHLLGDISLTDLFKFSVRHYRTKRQQVISAASLSKEYYSTGQVTAAVVRDMLLKMVARINHNFFPVLAVIGAATFVFAGIR